MSLLGHDRELQKYWQQDIRLSITGSSTGTWPPSNDHGTLAGLADDDHAQYQTVARHLAIGDSSPHHAAVTLAASADVLLGIATQALSLDTQTANYVLAGPTAAPAAAPTFRALVAADIPATIAGAGLTSTAGVLAVGAGTLITVGPDVVGITDGANYQFIGTGGGTVAGWRNVSELAGDGLTATNGVLAVGDPTTHLAVNTDHGTTADGHTHAITSSSNPGAAASILASDASGYLQLMRLGVAMAPTYPLDVTGDGRLSGGLNVGGATGAGAGQGFFGSEVRNSSAADGTPYTQTRLTVYRDASNWGYIAYGSDALMRVVYSRTVSAASMLFGTTSAVDNTGTFTETARLTAGGVLTTLGGINVGTTGGTTGIKVDGDLAFVGAQSITTTADNLTLAPAGDLILNPTGNDVLPTTGYDINLGSLALKYLTLHAAELWVETLVAQDTIATIGGRILVGPTTTLTADFAAGNVSMFVKHNEMDNGDRVYLEANGKVEFIGISTIASIVAADAAANWVEVATDLTAYITAGKSIIIRGSTGNNGTWVVASATYDGGPNRTRVTVTGDLPSSTGDGYIACLLETDGAYRYFVSRNLDGTGANDWNAGDAVFNTGTTGDGFIDLYSLRGVKAATEYGPSIVGNVRNSATYNDWTPHWAIGNLNGVYGYGVTTYGFAAGKYAASQPWIAAEATNGFRVMYGAPGTQLAQWDMSGNILVGQASAGQSNVYITSGALQLRNNAAVTVSLDATGDATFGTVAASKFNLMWDTSEGDLLLRQNTTPYLHVDGSSSLFKFGSDTSAVATTALALMGADQTYNGELLGAGDVLLGDNTASKANVLWDKSAGQLLFRGGVTTQTYIDTTGKLRAGSVGLDSAGVKLGAGGGLTTAYLGFYTDTTFATKRAYTTLARFGAPVDNILYNEVNCISSESKAYHLLRAYRTPDDIYDTEEWVDLQIEMGADRAGHFYLWGTRGDASVTWVDWTLPASGNGLAQILNTEVAIANGLRVGTTGTSSKMTLGLLVNQGAADDEAFAVQSTDVAHGITDYADTSTYAAIAKVAALTGGAQFWGFSEDKIGISLLGLGVNDDTARSTAAVGYVTVTGLKKSGTGVAAGAGANANLFVVRDNANARAIIDAEGDLHLDATSNESVWDDHDDLALLEAYRVVTAHLPDYRRRFASDLNANRDILARTGVLTLNGDGHPFVSYKGLTGLLIDALRQLGARVQSLEARLAA